MKTLAEQGVFSVRGAVSGKSWSMFQYEFKLTMQHAISLNKNYIKVLSVLFYVFLSISTSAQLISTFAGNGTNSVSGDSGPATNAGLLNPHFVARDRYGNTYYSDYSGCVVRKIDVNGIISRVAGTGTAGFNGDNILAANAQLYFPEGLACDTLGNLYIADHQNYRIRKVDITTGLISTIAGKGLIGSDGNGGLATNARLFPCDICFDPHGNLIFTDNTYHNIRKINTSGIISNIAGTGECGFTGDGGLAVNAKICGPTALKVDSLGKLYFVDALNSRVRVISESGVISTAAGTGTTTYNGDGISALIANIRPQGIAVYKGVLFIADGNYRVRVVDLNGNITSIAGTGVSGYNGNNISADTAEITMPGGMTTDSCGNVLFSDIHNYRIRKITLPICSKVNVNEIALEHDSQFLFVHPNPVENNLFLNCSFNINSTVIYNLLGQVVVQHAGSGKPQQQVDVSTLPPGVYIVRVNEVWTARLVKE